MSLEMEPKSVSSASALTSGLEGESCRRARDDGMLWSSETHALETRAKAL